MRGIAGVSGLLWMVVLAVTGGCAARGPLERFESKRVCMGVQTRIVIYASGREEADAAANAAYDRIAELEQVMSDYRPGSELMRLCARAGAGPVEVSPDLFDVLRISESLSRDTHGTFDITMGPAVALWREARKTGRLAGDEARARAMSLVGWRNVTLDDRARTATLLLPGMRLDLGGIGKGYAAQRAVEAIRARGLPRCLVALAGDIVVGEAPPGRAGWEIEIAGGPSGAPGPRVLLERAAVSTSGDTEQFIEIDGRRYSHILDARTGLGTEGGLAVTVIARRGEESDAIATAVCVMGREAGAAWLRARPGVAAFLEWKDGDGVGGEVIESEGAPRWAGPRP